jgi:hypothetical protein
MNMTAHIQVQVSGEGENEADDRRELVVHVRKGDAAHLDHADRSQDAQEHQRLVVIVRRQHVAVHDHPFSDALTVVLERG